MRKFLLTLTAIILASPAAYSDTLLRNAAGCVQAFSQAESRYGIPRYLLMAVANTESGRYHKGLKQLVPWPWTTNVAGKGGYHDSFHDAMTTVRRAQQRGINSVDVGCMQINLRHHPDAFANLKDAFNPRKNVDYAASFLRRNYDEFRSWPKAIAAYHSRSPMRGQAYYAKVKKRWRDVRIMAEGKPLSQSGMMLAANQHGVKTVYGKPVKRTSGKAAHSTFALAMKEGTAARVHARPGAASKKRQDTGMKVIHVKPRVTRAAETVVARPAPAYSPALASITNQTRPAASQGSVKVTHLASATAAPLPAKNNGPRFIFAD